MQLFGCRGYVKGPGTEYVPDQKFTKGVIPHHVHLSLCITNVLQTKNDCRSDGGVAAFPEVLFGREDPTK